MLVKQNAGVTIIRFTTNGTTFNTMTIAKNGGGFAGASGSLTGLGNGFWEIALTSGDTDTLGDLAIMVTDGSSYQGWNLEIVAFDPQDPVRLGLNSLPNANAGASNGIIINGSNSGNIFFSSLTIIGAANYLGGLTISNASGDALTITSSATNCKGMFVSGNGTAPAVQFTGGATGNAFELHGGATSGVGLFVTTIAGDGIHIAAGGNNADGIYAAGGTGGVSDGARFVAGTGGVDFRASGITGNTAQTGDSFAVVKSGGIGTTLSNTGIDEILDLANGVETGITVRQALRVLIAALAGKLNGAAGPTVNIRNIGDSLNRISATVDSSGNRTAVSLNLS